MKRIELDALLARNPALSVDDPSVPNVPEKPQAPERVFTLERDEQRLFWNWCCQMGIADSVVWHSTAHRTRGTLGTPDFIVPVTGQTVWIEFKMPGKKLSKDQEGFKASLERQDHQMHVVYSATEAIKLVKPLLKDA